MFFTEIMDSNSMTQRLSFKGETLEQKGSFSLVYVVDEDGVPQGVAGFKTEADAHEVGLGIRWNNQQYRVWSAEEISDDLLDDQDPVIEIG